MQLASITSRTPDLIRALEALSQRVDHPTAAQSLIEELCGITILVAQKFTNDRTADGLLEAHYLTIGCISLAISLADLPENDETKLTFLLHHGAEHVFQMGFRHIKRLSSLPYVAFVSDFDRDPFVQQRNTKALFSEICRAAPHSNWIGDDIYRKEVLARESNQKLVACAQWLRKHHFTGAVKDSDMDANAVIAITIIFGVLNNRYIIARAGQKEIETLIKSVRESRPDVDVGWSTLLASVPAEFHSLLRERMEVYRNTIIKKIQSKTSAKKVIAEIQDFYVSNELEVDYP